MKYTNSLIKQKYRNNNNYLVIRKKRIFIYNKKLPKYKVSIK